MARIDEYREVLRRQTEWEPFLLEHAGLPGPRANLELAAAVAAEADEVSAALGRARPGRGALRQHSAVPASRARHPVRASAPGRRPRTASG